MDGSSLWFENLQITNLDTALINENGIYTNTSKQIIENGLLVFPNPAKQRLTISHESYKEIQWQLIDQVGRAVGMGNSNHSNQVTIGGLPSGVYYLRWESDHQQGMEKIIKL
jgi:hypothetical protein